MKSYPLDTPPCKAREAEHLEEKFTLNYKQDGYTLDGLKVFKPFEGMMVDVKDKGKILGGIVMRVLDKNKKIMLRVQREDNSKIQEFEWNSSSCTYCGTWILGRSCSKRS